MKNFLKKLNETDIRHIAAILIILFVFAVILLEHFVIVPAANIKTVERSNDQINTLGFSIVIAYLFTTNKKDKSDKNGLS